MPSALKSFNLSVTNFTTSSDFFKTSFVKPKELKNLPKSLFANTVPLANPSTPANSELNSIPAAPLAIDIERVSSIMSDVEAPAAFMDTYIALYILFVCSRV